MAFIFSGGHFREKDQQETEKSLQEYRFPTGAFELIRQYMKQQKLIWLNGKTE